MMIVCVKHGVGSIIAQHVCTVYHIYYGDYIWYLKYL